MRPGETNRAQSRALIDDAGHHLPERQLTLPIVAQRVGQAEFLGERPERPDGADRETLLESDVFEAGQLREVALVLERQLDRIDLLGRALGDVGDGPLPRLSFFVAIGLANQVSGIALAGLGPDGGGVDMHSDNDYTYSSYPVNTKSIILMTTFCPRNELTVIHKKG